ncbi:MAG: hypothetical protein ABW047_02980 [Nitrospiraceae bacterium]
MRWLASLFFISSLLMSFPALAQPVQAGPSGDFRVGDLPGTAPTVGPPGGPSLPLSPTVLGDPIGAKSPDEILKTLDKDLGSRNFMTTGSSSDRSMEHDKEFRLDNEKTAR